MTNSSFFGWTWRTPLASVAKAIVACAIYLLASLPAAAEFTPEQKDGLAQKVAAFDTAIRGNDVAEILKVTPPKIYEFLSAQAGMSVDDLHKLVIEQMGEVMKDVEVQDLQMDIAKAEYLTTPDGTDYALVPSFFVMKLPEVGTMETTSHTLALMDDDQWYLLRIDNPQQLLIMKEVYPSFKNVEFPRGSAKVLE